MLGEQYEKADVRSCTCGKIHTRPSETGGTLQGNEARQAPTSSVHTSCVCVIMVELSCQQSSSVYCINKQQIAYSLHITLALYTCAIIAQYYGILIHYAYLEYTKK